MDRQLKEKRKEKKKHTEGSQFEICSNDKKDTLLIQPPVSGGGGFVVVVFLSHFSLSGLMFKTDLKEEPSFFFLSVPGLVFDRPSLYRGIC